MTEDQSASSRTRLVVPTQKTVFYTLDPADQTRYIELLTLNGIILNIDAPGGLEVTSTRLRIDGTNYLAYRCGIDITRDGDSVTVVASVLVAEARD